VFQALVRATKAAGILLLLASGGAAQEPPRDHVTYVEHYKDPVLTEMEDANRKLREEAERKTDEILAAQKAAKKQREDTKAQLRFAMSGIPRPAGPDAFATRVWHFPPRAQYLTSTCWSFSTTSFLESEVKRLTGQEIKLSEMWFVYWEYVTKAKGWVESRGQTDFTEGSQTAAVIRVMREHGVVPLEAYSGVISADGRFDHDAMYESLTQLLEWCRDQGVWDEDLVVSLVRRILDRTMGPPPEWKAGGGLPPQEFMTRVCRLDPDAYVDLMSTLSVPFWTRGEYAVPDNWWHGADYVNLPLEDWYGVIGRALAGGYSVVIGGDVSEPGIYGLEGIAVVPTFDIPAAYIDQDARELRFDDGSTSDDHGIHLVGHTRLDGHDWFLIKDSGRSSRRGKYPGYYMYRDDYVRLKMLTLTVHRDVVRDIVERVDGSGARKP
jgi:bleomycin hydrolase